MIKEDLIVGHGATAEPGKEVAWAYTHIPSSAWREENRDSFADLMEDQVERVAAEGSARRVLQSIPETTPDAHSRSKAMSERIAIMRNGRCEQVDTPQSVFSTPSREFVFRFIGESSSLPVQMVKVSGSNSKSDGGRPCRLTAKSYRRWAGWCAPVMRAVAPRAMPVGQRPRVLVGGEDPSHRLRALVRHPATVDGRHPGVVVGPDIAHLGPLDLGREVAQQGLVGADPDRAAGGREHAELGLGQLGQLGAVDVGPEVAKLPERGAVEGAGLDRRRPELTQPLAQLAGRADRLDKLSVSGGRGEHDARFLRPAVPKRK